MPEIEKCPCAGCRDKREVRLRTELASQAAKIEAVRSMTKAISAFARHSPNCKFNLTFGEKACDCGLTDLRVRLAALES